MVRYGETVPWRVHLPVLRELSLEGFPGWDNKTEEQVQGVIHLFNLENLSHLRLYNCGVAEEMLTAITDMAGHLKFRFLDIAVDEWWFQRQRPSDTVTESTVANFLSSFSGLKSLSVMIQPCLLHFGDYKTGILKHTETLKRLMWHQRRGVIQVKKGFTEWDDPHCPNVPRYIDYPIVAETGVVEICYLN